MNSIRRSFMLLKASQQAMQVNPMLVFYPIMMSLSIILLLAIIYGFGSLLVVFSHISLGPDDSMNTLIARAIGLLAAFIVLFAFTWISVFVNATYYLIADAALEGRQMMLSEALKNAWSYRGNITSWSLFAATVGYVISLVREKLGIFGGIVGWLAGIAWALVTLFIIPVLIRHRLSPVEAVKYSANLFKRTWGENLVADISLQSLGAMWTVLLLIIGFGVFSLFIAGIIPTSIVTILLVILAIILVFGIFYLQSAALIFNASLFRFAETGEVVGPFSAEFIQGAFRDKKSKGVFGK